jgi:hypothetical protein
MPQVGVFISYNHQDKIIANAIVEALTSISPDLDVFIDHAGLEGGDDYEAKLSKSIQKSQWFILVCSGAARQGKDMSWCFYEAGQFRAKLEQENQANTLRSRMCYLYDGEKPSQLARYQGTGVTAYDRSGHPLNVESESDDSLDYENTELFDLIDMIIEKSASERLRDLTDPSVRKLIRTGVRRITRAFIMNQLEEVIGEIVFQPRISFKLPAPNDNDPAGLTPGTAVVGEDNTLATIFGIAGGSTTWSDIKTNAVSSHGAEPLWIADVEGSAREVARGKVPPQTEFLCIASDGNFYRPIVARYEKYRSNAKKCFVVFIPSRNRQFAVSQRTSLLLSALILSIRFRQRVLPIVADLKAVQPGASGTLKKMDSLNKLQKEIIAIETEAVEFGLPLPKDEHDDPPLLNGFRDGPTKDWLRTSIQDWTATRTQIFDRISDARSPTKELSASDAAGLVVDAFGDMRKLNSEFITALCEELLYAEKIETPKE